MTALGVARGKARDGDAAQRDGARTLVSSAVLAAIALTLAGVLWVALGTMIAETGLRINQTVTERQTLLARRASARLHLAQITHPDSLEARARAMGFGPQLDVTGIAIMIEAGSVPLASVTASERPLAFRLSAQRAVEAESSSGTLLGIFKREEPGR